MRVKVETKGLFNSQAENKIPPGRAFAMQNAVVDDGNCGTGNRYVSIGSRPNALPSDVCFGFGYGKFACNETQALTLTGSPTSGGVVLRNPLTGAVNSLSVPYNAYPADIAAAVAPWTAFDDGELVFSGGPWPNETIYASYKGRYAAAAQGLITKQSSTLGGGTAPDIAISHFVNGGPAEGYLVVIQPGGVGTCTLYYVTSIDGFATTTWTSVATGLAASTWSFQINGDKIYAANATDSMTWFQLGGSWNGVAGIPNIQNPITLPAMAPATTDSLIDDTHGTAYGTGYDFTGATFGNFVGWGVNPTASLIANNHIIKLVLNAALNGDTVSFDITLPADADWSHEDFVDIWVDTTTTEITLDQKSMRLSLLNHDAAPATLNPPFYDGGSRFDGGTGSTFEHHAFWGSQDRSLRDNIQKITVTLTVPLGTNTKAMNIQIKRLGSFLNDMMDTVDVTAPIRKAIEYAYSYKKASPAAESKLSPSKFSPVTPATEVNGSHMRITIPGNAQLTTADFIKIYRKDRFGLWRLIGSVANVTVGSIIFTDTNMLDDLDGYPTFGVIHLPGGFSPSWITKWKQCLVALADRKAWISYIGLPIVFAPDPENFAAQSTLDPTDPNIPRTVYVSDDRSEPALSAVGQDSLYLAGPFTGYAMVDGDTPNTLSPPRPLPGSRGCLGPRATFQYSGGADIMAVSGLWYYSVSAGFQGTISQGALIEDELSLDVRTSWANVFGSAPSGAVVVVFNEETYCFNGAQFIKFTRNKHVEQGTLADPVRAIIGNQANGLIFATNTGQLMRFGSFTTDNTKPVSWSWTSGKMDGPRTRLEKIEVQYTGAPRIFVEAWDGNAGYDSQTFDLADGDGTVNFYPAEILLQGYRFRVTLSGTGPDHIEDLNLDFEDQVKGGKGN